MDGCRRGNSIITFTSKCKWWCSLWLFMLNSPWFHPDSNHSSCNTVIFGCHVLWQICLTSVAVATSALEDRNVAGDLDVSERLHFGSKTGRFGFNWVPITSTTVSHEGCYVEWNCETLVFVPKQSNARELCRLKMWTGRCFPNAIQL